MILLLKFTKIYIPTHINNVKVKKTYETSVPQVLGSAVPFAALGAC
jgi:hypothetical protein